MKTLVLGLGNPILSDDSVGFRVINEIRHRLNRPDVTVMEAATGGLNLLDLLIDHDKAIIIDAIKSTNRKPGEVYRLDPKDFDKTLHASSSHALNINTAIELGKTLGLSMPQQIIIYAIEVLDTCTFSEQCTPEVEKAIPVTADMVIREIDNI